MLVLNDTDLLQGDASSAAKVDYTLHGLVGSTLTKLGAGQLGNTPNGTLYTAGEIVVVTAITLVNTDTVACNVNLYIAPTGGSPSTRLIAKDLLLGAGYSLVFDGAKFTVMDISGEILNKTILSAASVANGGTGMSATVAYAPICGGTTTTGAMQSADTGISTSGYVLTSTGASSLPTFQAAAGGAQKALIYLGCESAYLPATNPAALLEVAGATVYGGWSYLAFDDTTSEHAIWRVPVPDYDGGNIIVTAFSKPATTPTGAVTLQYDILTIGLANSEAFNSANTVDTTVNISHVLDVTESQTDICIASATIDPANVAADDLLIIEIARDVTTDTLVGDGQLLGILLEYTRT
jgi:hypothetical protein